MDIRNLRCVFALVLALIALPAVVRAESSPTDSAQTRGNRHMVFISGGAGFNCSKVYDPISAAGNKIGFDYMAGYDWIISKSGLGVGLLYDGYYSSKKTVTSVDFGYGSVTPHTTIFVNTIAPQFVVDILRPESRWAFTFKVGLGLSTVTETLKLQGEQTERKTKCGFATTLMAGTERRINRHIGITATLTSISSFFGTFYDEYYDIYRTNNLSRISINVGLKYRF